MTDQTADTAAQTSAAQSRPEQTSAEQAGAPEAKGGAVTEEQVLEALKVVVDPELGINIVDLGLVYGVEVEDELVRVNYTLTSMGCPVGPLIEQQMTGILTQMPGVKIVEGRLGFTPPWSPEMMSEEARLAMGMF
jgi:metal-sulfur cluster biosynthetic enzyme